ncbi:MAG TPA: ATP-binding protein, partial [Acidimicrobiales bacterium]|nr:ATP-binding protein [Acidimicrobiales bacterium]
AVGASEVEAKEMELALGEAATNVVDHAYGPDGGDVTIDGQVDGDTVTVTVSDTGNWREPRGSNRGRGTMIMASFMDDLRVETDAQGTSVVLTKALGRTS